MALTLDGSSSVARRRQRGGGAKPAVARLRDLDEDSFADAPEGPTRHLTAEQLLAAAVVKQALADAQNRHLPIAHRAQARAWLAGSTDLMFWCEIGGLKVYQVQTLAGRVLGMHR